MVKLPALKEISPRYRLNLISGGKALPYQKLTFGDTNQEPLTVVWQEKSYREFRSAFYPAARRQPAGLTRSFTVNAFSE